jgi:hypothetical protein
MCVGLLIVAICVDGCQSHKYVTPAGGADIASLTTASLSDADIQEVLNRKPASPFPVRLAIVRIQASDYAVYNRQTYGRGRYTVLTTRETETEDYMKRLEQLPMITAVAPLSQILIPAQLNSDKELRLAAAKLHTDMVLVYTFNTNFRLKDHEVGPANVIMLGTLPNQEAIVTTTASCAIYDVRTGFTYGVAEATASEKQMTSLWVTSEATDELRVKTEKKSFAKLLDEIALTWKGIVEEYASRDGK